jgi:hypothetical protein
MPMIKLDPEDRLGRFDESRFSSFTKIMVGISTILIVVALFGGGFLYWYHVSQRPNYAHVYGNLGIASLPATVELQPQVQNRLDQLSREPCYRAAIYGLADALLEAGYPRETDTSLLSFAKRCGESDEILVRRYKALLQASDFSAALRVADDLVKSDPADAQVRYWRGNVHEELKDFARALTDYINTVQLMGDPDTISVNHFYDISRMYAALGRYCNAITPVETYISFKPAKNRTTQLTRLIAEYADKGNFDAHYATGTARVARVPFPGMIGVTTLGAGSQRGPTRRLSCVVTVAPLSGAGGGFDSRTAVSGSALVPLAAIHTPPKKSCCPWSGLVVRQEGCAGKNPATTWLEPNPGGAHQPHCRDQVSSDPAAGAGGADRRARCDSLGARSWKLASWRSRCFLSR